MTDNTQRSAKPIKNVLAVITNTHLNY